jgi:hypothetical protein
MKTRTIASATSLVLPGSTTAPVSRARSLCPNNELEPDAGLDSPIVFDLHGPKADVIGVFESWDRAAAVEGNVEFALQVVERALGVKDGEVAQWWKVLAFQESAQAELMRLTGGDALSVQARGRDLREGRRNQAFAGA